MFIFANFAEVLVKFLELDYGILNNGYCPANGPYYYYYHHHHHHRHLLYAGYLYFYS